ncbi:hypothetical protein [Halomonas binhaiensis]|uniref:Sulfotransferase domain-containing protein n=1 Tax=Halomonas binhaiensis TaxID=2562282 RepID=A0A5C1NIU7_9GAMM|nr:hypothetical protein [Halomonas binhaiensis]QEM82177.1 hypothetical protein E4T21_11935 [Halomonas binhaiensis]
MKLYIHFGIHRTGSTSIQACLNNSFNILKSHGFLYPRIKGMSDHVRIPWMLNSGKLSSEDVLAEIDSQKNELTHTVILSAEDFCLVRNSDFFERLKKEYSVSVVLYLKRQDLWLESWYNQHIKWPWDKKFSSCTPEAFLTDFSRDFYWMNYKSLLERLEKIFGKNNLKLNVVDSYGVKDTVKDFMQVVGIDSRWLNSYKDQNASLSSVKLDIIRRLDVYDLKPAERHKVIRAINTLDIPEDNGKKIVFSDEQVESILSYYNASNEYVAKKYFERDELFGDGILTNRSPVFISDDLAYKKYIPMLLKSVCREN